MDKDSPATDYNLTFSIRQGSEKEVAGEGCADRQAAHCKSPGERMGMLKKTVDTASL